MPAANAFHALDRTETLNKLDTRIKGLSQAEVHGIVAITSSIFIADEVRKLVQGRARKDRVSEAR